MILWLYLSSNESLIVTQLSWKILFRFTEKGNLEVLLFTIQSKMRANNQKVYMPREGKLISDINKVNWAAPPPWLRILLFSLRKLGRKTFVISRLDVGAVRDGWGGVTFSYSSDSLPWARPWVSSASVGASAPGAASSHGPGCWREVTEGSNSRCCALPFTSQCPAWP